MKIDESKIFIVVIMLVAMGIIGSLALYFLAEAALWKFVFGG